MVKGFLLGIVVAIAAVIAGGYFFVTSGAMPAGQDVKPGALERWAAKKSSVSVRMPCMSAVATRRNSTTEALPSPASSCAR